MIFGLIFLILSLILSSSFASLLVPTSSYASSFAPSYRQLEQISRTSEQFIPAMVELQKIHYRNQDWSRFFAYAIYYRNAFLSHPEQWPSRFHSRLLVLEAFALSQHCYWEEANQVLQLGIQIAHTIHSSDLAELETAISFFSSIKAYPQIQKSGTGSAIPMRPFQAIHYWSLNSKYSEKVRHPRFLRHQIESRCSK